MDDALPTPPSPLRTARFLRIARTGRALAVAGAAVFIANALASWLFPDYALHIARSLTHANLLGPMTPATRVRVALWDLPSTAVILMALYRLWQVFGEYQASRVFSARALAALHAFTRWLLAAALFSPVHRAGLSVLLTWQNGPGKRELDIDLSSADYLLVLLGVAALAVSSVMVEASRLAEENEGFV